MQHKNLDKNKIDKLLKIIGAVLRKLRTEKSISLNMLAYENELQSSLISRIENGKNEPNLISLWCISEALGIKMSELMLHVEKELPENWHLIDE